MEHDNDCIYIVCSLLQKNLKLSKWTYVVALKEKLILADK